MENLKVSTIESDNFRVAFGVSDERADQIGNQVNAIMDDPEMKSLSGIVEKAINDVSQNPNESAYIAFTIGKFIGNSDAMESILSSMMRGPAQMSEEEQLIEALMKHKPSAEA